MEIKPISPNTASSLFAIKEFKEKPDYSIIADDLYNEAEELNIDIEADMSLGFLYGQIAQKMRQSKQDIIPFIKSFEDKGFQWSDVEFEFAARELKNSGDLEGALENFKKTVELNPFDTDSWLFLADIYESKKENDMVNLCLNNAIVTANERYVRLSCEARNKEINGVTNETLLENLDFSVSCLIEAYIQKHNFLRRQGEESEAHIYRGLVDGLIDVHGLPAEDYLRSLETDDVTESGEVLGED